jgi:hypothetical protein
MVNEAYLNRLNASFIGSGAARSKFVHAGADATGVQLEAGHERPPPANEFAESASDENQ